MGGRRGRVSDLGILIWSSDPQPGELGVKNPRLFRGLGTSLSLRVLDFDFSFSFCLFFLFFFSIRFEGVLFRVTLSLDGGPRELVLLGPSFGLEFYVFLFLRTKEFQKLLIKLINSIF